MTIRRSCRRCGTTINMATPYICESCQEELNKKYEKEFKANDKEWIKQWDKDVMIK